MKRSSNGCFCNSNNLLSAVDEYNNISLSPRPTTRLMSGKYMLLIMFVLCCVVLCCVVLCVKKRRE